MLAHNTPMMKRKAIVTSIISANMVLLCTIQVSALGWLDGTNLRSSPFVGTMGSQRLDGNISNQATNFLNDIVANANENTCAQFTNHEYEVCTAYIFNSIFADLVPYYKFAMSDNASLARLVSFHLDSRFTGQANQLVRQRVAGWPSGEKDVDVPVIKILSVNASLADNSATLRTQETWLVTDQSEHVVFQETDAFHTITLSRVQSYVLHKWVVTDIE